MNFVQDGTCCQENDKRGSLGPVQNHEILVRVVRAPQHIRKKTGEIKPGLFSHSDIREKGVSVTRAGYFSKEDLLSYAKAVAEMVDGQKFFQLVSTETSKVRSIEDSQNRKAFCVLEDPAEAVGKVPANRAHAVTISAHGTVRDDELIELQMSLLNAFNSYVY